MPAYVVSEVSEVVDAAKMEEYRTLAQAAIERYGGRYIVRGGVWEAIEGEWALERVVVVEFPTVEQAKVWYHSPEYAKGRGPELFKAAGHRSFRGCRIGLLHFFSADFAYRSRDLLCPECLREPS